MIDISGGILSSGITNQDSPSCLILHGTADTKDPFSASKSFAESLKARDINVILHPLYGLNHELISRYDEVRNVMTAFLYKELTGEDVIVTTTTEASSEFKTVEERLKSNPVYHAKQIAFELDGKLDEWGTRSR